MTIRHLEKVISNCKNQIETFQVLSKARVVILPSNDRVENVQTSDFENISEPIPLPFETTWIERDKGAALFKVETSETPHQMFVLGILIREVCPSEYDIRLLVMGEVGDVSLYQVASASNEVRGSVDGMIRYALRALSTKTAVVAECPPITIRKTFGNKKNVKIREVVYISKEKYAAAKKGDPRYKISQHFEVRGHWRKIRSTMMGKNRDGVYCVEGFTWVTEHERGDKSAPLIIKTRKV